MKKACALALLVLCACSTREDTAVNAVSMTPEDMLAKIRANAEVQNEVMFQAMPDDAILDLHDQARQAQADGDVDTARRLLEQALAVDGKSRRTGVTNAVAAARGEALPGNLRTLRS